MSRTGDLHAIVKQVLSGDTLILRGTPKNNLPPPERILTLNFINSPKMGSIKKGTVDEDFAFESREYLRKLTVGKSITFKVTFTSAGGHEYGIVKVGNEDIACKMVEAGWCTLKENAKYNEEEEYLIETLNKKQEIAKSNKVGLWSEGLKSAKVETNFPEDPRSILNKFKGKKIPGIIEQVFDGSTLKINLALPSDEKDKVFYQAIMFNISGIKAPMLRKNVNGQPDVVEPFAEEAKFFVESRLLQKDIQVILEGINNTSLCGTILHPAGNIAEVLVSNGLAKVVDWTIAMVTNGPSRLRECERVAKEKKLKLWKSYVPKANNTTQSTTFEGTVTCIATADTIHVLVKNTNEEKKLQFASLRAPKIKDNREAPYAHQAKEYLRKTLIGKQVKVNIDYIKPAENGFEEKACATITFNNKNIGLALISKGLAFILRHRKDDDNRASNYDDLMIADEKAKEEQVGVYSTKEPPILRFTDASENLAKAKQFLSYFQRNGKVPAVIEHITNASRFKVYVPSQNCKLSFILSGINAPRLARTTQETSEPFAEEGYKFVYSIAMQRDVEIEVEANDKNGGFIGTLFINGINLAVKLLEQGYATVFESSADQSSYSNQLYAAERDAKNKNLRIWTTIKEYDEIEEEEDKVKNQVSERVKVVVSELVDGSKFFLQIINSEIEQLEQMMAEFSIHHSSNAGASSSFTPKVGAICSAKFSADGQWYRAKIRKISAGKADVLYIDYGNSETIALSNIRAIPEKFVKLKPQAIEAKLAYVRVPALEKDYGYEASNVLRDLVEGKQLNATIETKSQGVAHVALYLGDKYSLAKSVNAEMVKTGYGIVEKIEKLPASLKMKDSEIKYLTSIQDHIKKNRIGMWEFGEVADEE